MGSYRDVLSEMVKGVPPLAIMERYGGRVTTEYHREIHCIPFQVVLATQMLHAAGIAMAIKYEQAPQVVMGICGDGATSQGDFNEALNFAGVFKAPVVFVVQNNGWAISVPRRQQTATEYIAHRGPGFGMPGYVVDGNDLLAVYQVVADCVARARAGYGPSLVEALTYRLGAHTTADDPKKYRSEAELQEWTLRDPLIRYRKFLLDRYLLSEADDKCLYEEVRAQIQKTIERYEALPPPDPDQLFDLVYAEPTPQLQRQRLALRQYLEDGR
jgi:pyruvate dehydrogenase E1 component alpha subunit